MRLNGQVIQAARIWAHHQEVCIRTFGRARAEDLQSLAEYLSTTTTMSTIQAFQVVMQIEDEFRNRTERLLEFASEIAEREQVGAPQAIAIAVMAWRQAGE